MNVPSVIRRVEHVISPWLGLVETALVWPGRRQPDIYHAISQADYASVLAITLDGRVPLVSQYRPGCGEVTLELPGGLLENGESADACARREMFEEVGCEGGQLSPLGVLWPDPGRLTNRLYCYVAVGVDDNIPRWRPEPNLDRHFVRINEIRHLLASGQLSNAHHVAIIGLAMAAGISGI